MNPVRHPSHSGLRRWLPWGGVFLFVLAGCTGPAVSPTVKSTASTGARNAYVVLSGGGLPQSNNYSQFLQARALSKFLERRYPAESTWLFFGVGNREGEAPLLADTRRQSKRDGLVIESWLPGVLPRNRPATRESFLQALRTEILPTVRDGGTLFLFVGDHGTISKGDRPESLVTMWQMKPGAPGSPAWSTDFAETLGVAELRAVLAEGIGRGRVVFCMTQCHSGGFHYLGVPREVAPPPGWFVGASPVAPAASPVVPALLAAGFTSTEEESLAAGCDPDPDPDRWAGYERFVPEQLLGLDLFTLEPAGAGRSSFAAAHEAAVLVDRTIDLPRSSSEQFLERWAQAFEKLAARPEALTPRAAAAVREFLRSVDTGRVEAQTPALRAKVAEFERFTAQLVVQNSTVNHLLRSGSRQQLAEAIGSAASARSTAPSSRPAAPAGRPPGSGAEASRKLWREVVRPAWKTALLAGAVTDLPPEALAFEKRLLEIEDGGRELMYPAQGDPMLNEIFWRSGYAFPAKMDRAKAEAVARWGAERKRRVVTWAKASADEKVRQAGTSLERTIPRAAASATTPPAARGNHSTRPLAKKTAAGRALFYRRTLAAWACLIAMDERAALQQLAALMELERTPLPPPTL